MKKAEPSLRFVVVVIFKRRKKQKSYKNVISDALHETPVDRIIIIIPKVVVFLFCCVCKERSDQVVKKCRKKIWETFSLTLCTAERCEREICWYFVPFHLSAYLRPFVFMITLLTRMASLLCVFDRKLITNKYSELSHALHRRSSRRPAIYW